MLLNLFLIFWIILNFFGLCIYSSGQLSFFYLIMFLFVVCLYLVAKEGWKNDGCTNHKKAGTHECHDIFGYTFFTDIHLDIDLHDGVDGDDC